MPTVWPRAITRVVAVMNALLRNTVTYRRLVGVKEVERPLVVPREADRSPGVVHHRLNLAQWADRHHNGLTAQEELFRHEITSGLRRGSIEDVKRNDACALLTRYLARIAGRARATGTFPHVACIVSACAR